MLVTTIIILLLYNVHICIVAVRLSDQDLLIIEILTELDREIIDNYIILINATDGGGCSSYINLIINLIDVNEQPPVFNSSNGYVTHITEDNYQQYVVYTVSHYYYYG